MRQPFAIVGLIGFPLALGIPVSAGTAADEGTQIPVIVELYTSEGCSDCPPADRILSDLIAEQSLAGVEIIALGEHVDYWNYLGWTDRFSSAALTQRQQHYHAKVFASSPVYTPQLVVDGRLQAVGSDRGAVRRVLQRAAQTPKAEIRLHTSTTREGRASATVEVAVPAQLTLDGPADIVMAVVEDGLFTAVPRGENRGRTLEHDAVVRRLAVVGEMRESDRAASLTTSIPLAEGWRAEHLRIITFVQERDSRRIVGAASATLPE